MLVSTKEIEVRYAETDQMGVVYHANYIIWMELGRTQFVKDLGFNYAALEEQGVLSPVLDIQASYKKPLHYGETATVKTWVEAYDGLRTTYGYEIYNQEGILAVSGSSLHTCVKKDSFRPISLRRKFPDWHEAYENAKK
ncbi:MULTISPECIES: acyl-CoA thioesterase [Cytobacillus]|uniref:Acyl-CoA thioesterase n=1 Tax=Cytobacillus stercorigallinarum TaxID=2762240 RepID=A0ABR8QLS7_9BACI|nr:MULTISPECIES: thioesterase family protein [Cytobacillus]MBD7936454.1 acyl-CoA thioesterase [Cytobacillus stercorigallinarum]MCA1025967.1 acyl-CoA thioesterase [Cytobacillus kochii]MCM3321438.1 acyl-CoA thioesterase [Cytobacillus kochii]MCM3343728.1 acyl-CoA thioesterase [Cytobacillus kochii]MDM5207559.1 thioesterase family protein [Cytobacillus kochii]